MAQIDEALKPAVGYAMYLLQNPSRRLKRLLDYDEIVTVLRADMRASWMTDSQLDQVMAEANRNIVATANVKASNVNKTFRTLCGKGTAPTDRIGVRIAYRKYTDGVDSGMGSIAININATEQIRDAIQAGLVEAMKAERQRRFGYQDLTTFEDGRVLQVVCGGISGGVEK